MTPASVFLSALIITINRIVVPPTGFASGAGPASISTA
jgi:hypothetical protein